ncbi:MAG: phosphate ABC transporter substrate-binding protein, partial [Methanomicrobia archaeon]|nr:phosphate ABC transporter substrate-binding protein [Methanomicrobia archaeon]
NKAKTISIAGSTTVQPISDGLAEAFMEKYDINVTIQGGGSGTGIKMVGEGTVDIGASSREVKEDEKEKYNIKIYPIAIDGLAIIVHPSNKIENLSIEQLKRIFVGEIENWKELGGEDKEIVLVVRAEGSGTRDFFEKKVMGDVPLSRKALQKPSNGAVKATIASNENAIGYIGAGYIDDYVKAVRIEGVYPDPENIRSGEYELSRKLYYITKKESENVKKFMNFVLSDEGQDIVETLGFIRIG